MALRHFDTEIEPIIISTGKRSCSFVSFSIDMDSNFADEIEVRHDECPRQGVSLESLAKLHTTYKEGRGLVLRIGRSTFVFIVVSVIAAGTVTSGNASGDSRRWRRLFDAAHSSLCSSLEMGDGAAALLLSSMSFAKSKQLLPLARIVSWAQSGVDPLVMVRASRDDDELRR